MNKNNFYKLLALSEGLSILYIEKSVVMQKQIALVLSKIFKTYYQSFDGTDGYEKFKYFNPDIILMDSSIVFKSSLELITDIKEMNPNAKIIVLSTENSDCLLLKSMDMGISSFLTKPLDIDKLIVSLINTISTIPQSNEEQLCFSNIRNLYKTNSCIEFLNSYKGIPIHNEGLIVNVKQREFTVKLSPVQIVAIKNESSTVIKSKDNNRCIQANVKQIDTKNNLIIFIKPKFINFTAGELKCKRIETNSDFKVGLHFNNKLLDVKSLNISANSIVLYLNMKKTLLKIDDTLDMTFGFNIDSSTSLINDKRFVKIFAKGQVNRVQSYNGGFKIVVDFKVRKADNSTFDRYLQQREIEIIGQFKRLVKRY